MATLAGILIADKYSYLDSGAAFLLAQKCDISEVVCLNSGWEIEVRESCPYVVARIKGASSASDAFNNGHEAIQQGLDLLAITGKADLSLRNASDEYLTWWREKSIQVLRIVTVTKLPVTTGIPTVVVTDVVTDKDNDVIPQPPAPKLIYHESLRYFRLSQVTDDLFDAFRNMYLAFELLLEYVVLKGENEGEGKWLKRALNSVNDTVPLSRVYSSTNPNIVLDIYNSIYKSIRCSIFHAKNQSRLLPQDLADRKRVSESLDRLTRIVLLLTEHWLHARRPSGGMFYAAFNKMTMPVASSSIVIISDNDAPLDASETIESPTCKDSVPMPTKYAPELSKPGLISVMGTVDAVRLQSLCKVAKLELVHDDELMLGATFEAPLIHNAIDRLEAQIGMQLINVREPKHFFKG